MEQICEKFGLLQNNNGVVRVPFLIKGKIIVPPETGRDQIEAAFQKVDRSTVYLKLPEVQIIREPVIDRRTLKYTGEYIHQVMPAVSGQELVEKDTGKLVGGLYALPVSDILDYLSSISAILSKNRKLVEQAREICRLTVEYPDAFLEAWFAAFQSVLDRELARQMVDNELSLWGRPGGDFLEGWVEATAEVIPGLAPLFAGGVFGQNAAPPSDRALIRAMPTRQLHITAGNAPEIPIISALRAILTKSAAVIKSPYGATLSGALLALAAGVAAPDHPITQNLSLVYWQGGDESVESVLFLPDAFDRIVVWGSPETVASVQSRALFTRTIYLNPRYGISMIGQEAFQGDLEEVAMKASTDSLIYNQKACIASLVHYVEGTEEQANRYAALLSQALARWDAAIPQFVLPSARGQIKRLRRGKYSGVQWYLNGGGDEFTSGVAVMPGEFDVLDHPTCRLVIVRRVDKLTDVFQYLHPGVSAAGIFPEERRLALRDQVAARGVSSILPLGQCERLYPGMPHDGMMVLSQLVDWKNA